MSEQNRLRNSFRPGCEPLGDRAMPSITLTNGLLSVSGTEGGDVIQVTVPADGKIQVTVSRTGEKRVFNAANVSAIDIACRGGNDTVRVGERITVGAAVRGGSGDDSVTGGSGDDSITGGGGNDFCDGRGGDDTLRGTTGRDRLRGGDGNDDLFGEDGDDDCQGGIGDDSVDGGSGRDSCRGGDGDDDVRNGFDPDTELIAVFTNGQGSAEFKFGPEDGGIEREFEAEVEDLAASTAYGVFVGDSRVGTITTDTLGDGGLEFETDFDRDRNGAVDFPAGFPEIGVGSVVTVRQADGTVVREGTFVANPGN